MAKKKGRSERKKDWLGRSYIQHYDADNNKRGRSEQKKTFFGNEYTQHYDAKDNKRGHSERKETWLGREYTQKYDSSGQKSGTSEKKNTLFGKTYTQHYDSEGSEGDRSESERTWFGKKYVQRYGSDKPDLRENRYPTSDGASKPDSHSGADYQSAHRGISRFWAIAFGWIAGFIFIEVAGPAIAVVVTAMHLSMPGRTGALLVFWLYAVGVLVGVTATEILRGRRQRAGKSALGAICLTLAIGVLLSLVASPVARTNGAEVGVFAGTHWLGHVGRSFASLDMFSTDTTGALSARMHYGGLTEDLMVTRSPNGTLVLRGKGYRKQSGTGPFALDTLYGEVSPDGRHIHGSLVSASQPTVQWSATKLVPGVDIWTTQQLPTIQTMLPIFHVTVNYDQTMIEMVNAGKYNWIQPDWISEVRRDPLFANHHGTSDVEIVLVHFNREMRTEEAIRELREMNLRPIDVAELLAFGATYRRQQVEYPIVALGSIYEGWSPSLDNSEMPMDSMVGRGLSLGGNRNGGDMWESSSRFGAVCK